MTDPPAVFNLVIIGVTVYISYRGFQSGEFVKRYVLSPVRILRDREWHRLVSSAFLHGSGMHLLFNMFSLYCFGRTIETGVGADRFLLIYFASICGGGLLSLYLHRGHEDYQALGASGGVCGIMFAHIFLFPGGGVVLFPLPLAIPGWLYAVVFLLVSFFGMRSGVGRIGHDAHLGGALVGLAVTTLIRPAIVPESPLLYATVVAITGGLLYYTYRHPLHLSTSSPFTRAHWQAVRARRRAAAGAKRQAAEESELDRLLDKISESGMDSLSRSERKRLTEISKRRNARH